MNTIEIAIGKKSYKFTIPGQWNELTPEQLLTVCRASKKGLSEDEFLMEVLMALMPEEARNVITERYAILAGALPEILAESVKEEISDEITDLTYEVSRILALLEWLREPACLTRNPFRELPCGRKTYPGPADELRNITYYEYALVDTLMGVLSQAVQDGKKEDADDAMAEITAILWHKEGELYDEVKMKARKEEYNKMDEAQKDAVYMFVAGCFKHITEAFPRIFTPSGEGSDDPSWGHAGIIIDLAGPKFGDIEKTQNTNLYTILIYLDKQAQEAEKTQNTI